LIGGGQTAGMGHFHLTVRPVPGDDD